VSLKFANSKRGKQLRKMHMMFWSSFSRVLDIGAGIDCSKQKYVIAGTSLLSSDDHPGTLFLVHLLVLFGIFFFSFFYCSVFLCFSAISSPFKIIFEICNYQNVVICKPLIELQHPRNPNGGLRKVNTFHVSTQTKSQ